jgi:hypothetical protein
VSAVAGSVFPCQIGGEYRGRHLKKITEEYGKVFADEVSNNIVQRVRETVSKTLRGILLGILRQFGEPSAELTTAIETCNDPSKVKAAIVRIHKHSSLDQFQF